MMCCCGSISMAVSNLKPSGSTSARTCADGHLVFGADGDVGIFGAIFEEHETPAGLERVADVVEHLFGLGELVIDVYQQHEIELSVGEFRDLRWRRARVRTLVMWRASHVVAQLSSMSCWMSSP